MAQGAIGAIGASIPGGASETQNGFFKTLSTRLGLSEPVSMSPKKINSIHDEAAGSSCTIGYMGPVTSIWTAPKPSDSGTGTASAFSA